MMTVVIQHDFLFVVTYQSAINCLIVHTITVSFVKVKNDHRSKLERRSLKEKKNQSFNGI